MNWKVILFETTRKEKKPVEKFILSLEKSSLPKIAHVVDLLETYGNLLRMPYSRKVTKEIFELRIRGIEEVRILYTFGKEGKIYLLHGFKKKKEKTPKSEIILAEARLDKI